MKDEDVGSMIARIRHETAMYSEEILRLTADFVHKISEDPVMEQKIRNKISQLRNYECAAWRNDEVIKMFEELLKK